MAATARASKNKSTFRGKATAMRILQDAVTPWAPTSFHLASRKHTMNE